MGSVGEVEEYFSRVYRDEFFGEWTWRQRCPRSLEVKAEAGGEESSRVCGAVEQRRCVSGAQT